MSEELFIRHCAPTLAGLKTGNLFACEFESEYEMRNTVKAVNRRLRGKGLCFVPMKDKSGKALLYLFRPESLQKDIKCREAREILRKAGYTGLRYQECIRRLIARLDSGESFPHEIGLFLSYPPEDVKGFIENHARNYKLIGYWKVYGDEEKARRTFEQYRKCTDSYCRRMRAGYKLAELAVAI